MRNLKKILALVLALVMSLSLMATAGAKGFEDSDKVGETYQTAVEVLNGLGVFGGYDLGNGNFEFRPQNNITRAEVATIIYRIVTGDVKGEQAAIYTDMANSKLKDLNQAEWARGFVNYCYNAGIIKGVNDTDFEPNSNITGYAALTMILRAIGYGQNGEFVGNEWEINTASRARSLGLLSGITDAQLGQPASRELVAQILFRTMLKETVTWTALQGYQGTGTTLGKQQFGLEEIKGVVVANQWANLEEGKKVLAVDQTKLEVTEAPEVGATSAEGDVITLNYATDLEAVGLTHTAYISKDENGNKKVLTMEATGNVIADNEGYAVNTNNSDEKYESVEDLADSQDLDIDYTTTEFYNNYDENWWNSATHKILIRYTVDAGHFNGDTYVQDVPDGVIRWLNTCVESNVATRTGSASEPISYTRTISPRYVVEGADLDIMEEIFYTADRQGNNPEDDVENYITGEVYVGTSSLVDVSDKIDWDEFCETYLTFQMDYQYANAENGESLRVIDNDGDGVADYVFKVEYTLDEVIGTYKSALLLNNEAFKDYSAEKNTLVAPEDLEQGDVVVFSKIDGQLHVRLAETDDAVIDTKNFKNITVTTETPDTYGQSGITNATDMDQDILNMNQKTEYIMYKDLFGFVRAYKLAQGSKYALLTEMYPGSRNNGNYIKDTWAVAEVKIGDADVANYNVNDGVDNIFFSDSVWTQGRKFNSGYNYLQPAVAHLDNYINSSAYTYNAGATTAAAATAYSYAGISWDRDAKAADTPYGVFMTDTDTPDAKSFTFTNVAVYSQLTEEDVTLDTAAKLLKDRNGNQEYYWIGSPLTIGETTYNAYELKVTAATWDSADMGKTFSAAWENGDLAPVYKTDYVQLVPQDVEAKTIHYTIDENYQDNYKSIENSYVDATVDTEFYIVTPDDILYFEGYNELPDIDADKVRATYAVATNTADDVNDKDYWVADVIVIEVSELESSMESISLMFYSPWETTGSTRYVNSLNNKWRSYLEDNGLLSAAESTGAMIDVVPGKTSASGAPVGWGNDPWSNTDSILSTGYGIYKLYKTEADGANTITAARAVKILRAEDYSDFGVYAGQVTRVEGLQKSGYIDVDTVTTGSGRDQAIWVGYTGDDVPIYRISQRYNNRVIEAVELELNNNESRSDVKKGDDLIWVYEKANGKLAFIVDLTASTQRGNNPGYFVPEWLYDVNDTDRVTTLFGEILEDMDPAPAPKETATVIIKTAGLADNTETTSNVEPGTDLVLKEATLAKTGFTIDDDGVTYAVDGDSATDATKAGTAPNRTWTIPVADADTEIEVTVTYKPAVVGYAITATADTTATITGVTVTVKDADGTAVTTTGTVTVGTASNVTWNYTEGATVTIALAGLADDDDGSYYYDYTVGGDTTAIDNGTETTYSFTVPQPTTGAASNALAIDGHDNDAVQGNDANTPTNYSITPIVGGVEKAALTNTAAAIDGAYTNNAISFKVEAADTYVIATLQYTVDSGTPEVLTTEAVGEEEYTIEIPADEVTGDIEITVTVVKKDITLNFAAAATTKPGWIIIEEGETDGTPMAATGTVSYKTGTITVKSINGAIIVSPAAAAQGTATPNNDGTVWTITNVTVTGDVTISPMD